MSRSSCAPAPPTPPEIKTEVEGLVARLREKRTGVVWIERCCRAPSSSPCWPPPTSSCAPRSTSPWASSTSRPWLWACRSSAQHRGIPDVIVDGETGLLVPIEQVQDGTGTPIDPARFEADLAERLTTLVTDTEAARTMGQAARRRVEEHFAWEAIAQRTMDVYNWVLTQG